MRKMGGLYKLIPITYAFMWIGSLALMGIGIPGTKIGFAGFHSKDIVLEAAYAAQSTVGSYAFWLGIVAAFMTAFYSSRLMFLTFHGQPRCDEQTLAHVHESPAVMWVPLVVLVIGSLIAGAAGYHLFVGDGWQGFWREAIYIAPGNTALEDAHLVPFWVKASPLVVGLAAIALAWWVYLARPGTAGRIAGAVAPLYRFSLNKWYFDELYERVFIRPAFYLGQGFWRTDAEVIDGVGPDGVAAMTGRLARFASWLQSGYVYHYAFAMLIGVVCLVTWYLLFGV